MARNYVYRDSFILTNIGRFDIPESMQAYIEDYGAILPCGYQPFGILVSSYQGVMKISLAQREDTAALSDAILAQLADCGIHANTKVYTYHPTRYEGTRLMKRPSNKYRVVRKSAKTEKPVNKHTKKSRTYSRSAK